MSAHIVELIPKIWADDTRYSVYVAGIIDEPWFQQFKLQYDAAWRALPYRVRLFRRMRYHLNRPANALYSWIHRDCDAY